jgi:replicative DNA helicase
VPEKETLQSFFPNFEFSESSEPLQFFLDEIKKKHKKNLYNKGLIEIVELMKDDIDGAEQKLQQLLSTSKTEIKTTIDLDVRANADLKKLEYEGKKNHLGIDGYETPWEYLNNLTGGFHNGELIVISARPKMCKTWLLTWIARHIWRECNVPEVFITKEMRPVAIRDRLAAIETGLPYDALKRGFLTDIQQSKYYEYLDKLEAEREAGEPTLIIPGYSLSDTLGGVSSLIPKVEQHLLGGGVLLVDGLYLLPDDRGEKDWKAIVNISMDLKNLALAYNIPVIATTQQNMADKNPTPTFEGAAYGKYLVQFVDAFLGIGRNVTDRNLGRGRIYMLGQREGDIGDFPINMKFSPVDFSQAFEKTVEDTNQFDDEDDEIERY